MNPAVTLLRQRQGHWAIKDYVMEICELCYHVVFNDIAAFFAMPLLTIVII